MVKTGELSKKNWMEIVNVHKRCKGYCVLSLRFDVSRTTIRCIMKYNETQLAITRVVEEHANVFEKFRRIITRRRNNFQQIYRLPTFESRQRQWPDSLTHLTPRSPPKENSRLLWARLGYVKRYENERELSNSIAWTDGIFRRNRKKLSNRRIPPSLQSKTGVTILCFGDTCSFRSSRARTSARNNKERWLADIFF